MNEWIAEHLKIASENVVSLGQELRRENVSTAELAQYGAQLRGWSELVMHYRDMLVRDEED